MTTKENSALVGDIDKVMSVIMTVARTRNVVLRLDAISREEYDLIPYDYIRDMIRRDPKQPQISLVGPDEASHQLYDPVCYRITPSQLDTGEVQFTLETIVDYKDKSYYLELPYARLDTFFIFISEMMFDEIPKNQMILLDPVLFDINVIADLVRGHIFPTCKGIDFISSGKFDAHELATEELQPDSIISWHTSYQTGYFVNPPLPPENTLTVIINSDGSGGMDEYTNACKLIHLLQQHNRPFLIITTKSTSKWFYMTTIWSVTSIPEYRTVRDDKLHHICEVMLVRAQPSRCGDLFRMSADTNYPVDQSE